MGPDMNHPDLHQALLCSECALCEAYACTMDLSPMAVNRDLKKTLSASGTRYPGGELPEVHIDRERLKIPTKRLLSRLQLSQYRLDGEFSVKEIIPKKVSIPLQQHIGAPARPVVSVGDRVKRGDLIADSSGKISATVHASIQGEVESVADNIVIVS